MSHEPKKDPYSSRSTTVQPVGARARLSAFRGGLQPPTVTRIPRQRHARRRLPLAAASHLGPAGADHVAHVASATTGESEYATSGGTTSGTVSNLNVTKTAAVVIDSGPQNTVRFGAGPLRFGSQVVARRIDVFGPFRAVMAGRIGTWVARDCHIRANSDAPVVHTHLTTYTSTIQLESRTAMGNGHGLTSRCNRTRPHPS